MKAKIPGEVSFFEHVISRAEEILTQNSFACSGCYISEVVTHKDLLERMVRLPSQLVNGVTAEYLAIWSYAPEKAGCMDTQLSVANTLRTARNT